MLPINLCLVKLLQKRCRYTCIQHSTIIVLKRISFMSLCSLIWPQGGKGDRAGNRSKRTLKSHDHINLRILNSGSKAQDRGRFQKPWFL